MARCAVLRQRTFEIWSFAFKFFFRLWLSGRKFSYGKQARAWPLRPAVGVFFGACVVR